MTGGDKERGFKANGLVKLPKIHNNPKNFFAMPFHS